MKQTFDSEIFEIKDIKADHDKIINIIAQSNNIITDFNSLMEYYENNKNIKNGILLICKYDVENTVMYQHLVLFADHYKIKMASLKKDTKQKLEKVLNKKKIFLVYYKMENETKCINMYDELERLCFT